jgi:hypothetical protein
MLATLNKLQLTLNAVLQFFTLCSARVSALVIVLCDSPYESCVQLIF